MDKLVDAALNIAAVGLVLGKGGDPGIADLEGMERVAEVVRRTNPDNNVAHAAAFLAPAIIRDFIKLESLTETFKGIEDCDKVINILRELKDVTSIKTSNAYFGKLAKLSGDAKTIMLAQIEHGFTEMFQAKDQEGLSLHAAFTAFALTSLKGGDQKLLDRVAEAVSIVLHKKHLKTDDELKAEDEGLDTDTIEVVVLAVNNDRAVKTWHMNRVSKNITVRHLIDKVDIKYTKFFVNLEEADDDQVLKHEDIISVMSSETAQEPVESVN